MEINKHDDNTVEIILDAVKVYKSKEQLEEEKANHEAALVKINAQLELLK